MSCGDSLCCDDAVVEAKFEIVLRVASVEGSRALTLSQ
jgi:hypothetical protein